MSWLRRLLGQQPDADPRPQRLDYLNEALALERQGDYDAAITSYQLALRDNPQDHRVLQNLAIAYSKTARLDEAIRSYRRALEIKPNLSGAHYGLAFLLIKRDDLAGADRHLSAFLAEPPRGPDAEQWIEHAERTLEQLRNPRVDESGTSDDEHHEGSGT
jgi:Flp pilus assembly protein TadD